MALIQQSNLMITPRRWSTVSVYLVSTKHQLRKSVSFQHIKKWATTLAYKFTCELEGLTEAQADLLEGKAIELFDRKKEVLLMRIPETGKQVEIDYQTASVTKRLSNPELCYISSFVILN